MKKKICFIVSSPYTAQFLTNHLKELSKEYTIFLVANIKDADNEFLKSLNFDYHKSISINRNINVFKDLIVVYKLYKYFKLIKFDAIHSITPKAGLISALAGKLAGIKNRIHIYTGQVWATKTGFFKTLLKTLDKVIANLSTKILVDSNSQRDFLVTEKILKKNQGIVLGIGSISGVNLIQFSPNLKMKAKIRKDLNLSDDIVIYLFLGRLNIDKGIIELSKAFNKLSQENKKVFLLLVGVDEGSMLDKINNIIVDKNSFRFVGSTPTPEIYYQACDVFCLPSYREGFGTSVIEASACKIPVICSDAYGLRDTIIDNETGLRHKVKDVDGLYEQMKKLSKDRVLREYLAENGLKYTHENFSSDTITQEWLNFYKNLV